jgi:hypothetical protein
VLLATCSKTILSCRSMLLGRCRDVLLVLLAIS